MKRFLLLSMLIAPELFCTSQAYTVYSDMAGSGSLVVWGYSYTDLAAEDWHYSAQAIYQTLRDPNGVPTSAWGGSTFASISQPFTVSGDYNLLARHEMYCTLHNALVTPNSNLWGNISIHILSMEFYDWKDLDIGQYRRCNPGWQCPAVNLHKSRFGGILPLFAYVEFLAVTIPPPPLPTVVHYCHVVAADALEVMTCPPDPLP
ncbi:MAG: hypothetical protein Kow001_02810 [Acidobacteriota bacterium]